MNESGEIWKFEPFSEEAIQRYEKDMSEFEKNLIIGNIMNGGVTLKLLNEFDTIKYTFDGIITDNSKICIFAHYDEEAQVKPYVVYYLNKLKEKNYSIYFVSTAPKADDDIIEQLLKICTKVIYRENIGYDFGSWQIGLKLISSMVSNINHVLLANDSVYGPIFDMDVLFNDYSESQSDFYGASDSYQTGYYHIQSYFMIISNKVLNSTTWLKFWDNLKNYHRKDDIIVNFEIGLSMVLMVNGFNLNSYCKSNISINDAILKEHIYSSQLMKSSSDYNLTHVLWDFMISEYNFPFIKKELIEKNPLRLKTLQGLSKVINETNYDIQLMNIIENCINEY